MSTIVTRSGKGSPLTHAEMDANFTNLNTDKAELTDLSSTTVNKGAALIGINDTESKFTGTTVETALQETRTEVELSATSGSSLVGYIHSGTSATARTLETKLRESVSVKDFGAVGDGVADDTTALANARAHVAATGDRLVFPAGTYKYTVSPNWAIANAEIVALGEVRLFCTGTGHGVIFDAGSGVGTGVYNVTFGRFICAVASGGLDAVYVRGIHHSTIDVRVNGSGTGRAGLRVEFAVCTRFPRLSVTPNPGDMPPAGSAVPYYGMVLTQRNAGESASYCVFDTPVLEGLTVGIFADVALGNLFLGGTSEGHSEGGIHCTPNSLKNKVVGMDFEVNTTYDILNQGQQNAFLECDTQTLVSFDSNSRTSTLQGGIHKTISIGVNAFINHILDVKYNAGNVGGTLTDLGDRTRLSCNQNLGTGLVHDAVPGGIVVAVGASPFTFTNTYGTDIILTISGGTVGSYTFTLAGVSNNIDSVVPVIVPHNGQVTIGYTVAPTVKIFKK